MKNLVPTAIASILLTASAFATPYADSNPADVWLNGLHPSYTGTFTLDGYNPAVEKITAANVEFLFKDPLGGSESLKVLMGGYSYTHSSFMGSLTLGGGVGFNGLADLSADGILSYTVSITSGGFSEFWLTNASITATGAPLAITTASLVAVPDSGSSIALVVLGLAGIFGAKRKFFLSATR
jgi:hypothetical protein